VHIITQFSWIIEEISEQSLHQSYSKITKRQIIIPKFVNISVTQSIN